MVNTLESIKVLQLDDTAALSANYAHNQLKKKKLNN